MATVQIIEQGFRNLIIKVDGAGSDSLATIVDVTTLTPPCSALRLKKITYSMDPAGTAELFWDATTDVSLLKLFGSNDADMCFEDTAGIPNNAGAGKTGNVLLTTSAHPYTMYISFLKSNTYQDG